MNMIAMKKHLCLCLLLMPFLAYPQATEYKRFMDAGHREIRAKNYEMAGKKFTAALEFAFSPAEQKEAHEAKANADRMRVAQVEDALKKAERVIGYFDFREGRTWVYQYTTGKFGLIDQEGKQLTNFEFTDPKPFEANGYAIAQKDSAYYFIDKKGGASTAYTYIIPTNNGLFKVRKGNQTTFLNADTKQSENWDWYDTIFVDFDNLLQVTKNGKTGLVKRNGQVVLKPEYDQIEQKANNRYKVLQSGKWGLIDENGQIVIAPQFEFIDHFNFGKTRVMQQGKWGQIDQNGRFIIAPKFDSISYFNERMAAAKLGEKWGYIDSIGTFVIAPQFDEAKDFYHGIALVSQTGKWGLIDSTGIFVCPPQFEFIGYFDNGVAAAKKDGMWGFIDSTGKTVVPFIECDNIQPFSGTLLYVTKGEQTYLMDMNSQQKLDLQFENDGYLGYLNDNRATVYSKGKCGYIDQNGKIVVPLQFEECRPFFEGSSVVRQNNKMGVIDSSGAFVVSPQFDYLENFHKGFAMAGNNRKLGFIDKTGSIVVPLQFDDIDYSFDNHAIFLQNGRRGVIDMAGKVVIPPQFDEISNFHNGFWGVKRDGKYGVINQVGQVIIPLRYDKVDFFEEGTALVLLFNEWFIANTEGQMVLDTTPISSEKKNN
jgi:WG containing repeat